MPNPDEMMANILYAMSTKLTPNWRTGAFGIDRAMRLPSLPGKRSVQFTGAILIKLKAGFTHWLEYAKAEAADPVATGAIVDRSDQMSFFRSSYRRQSTAITLSVLVSKIVR